MLLVHGDSIAAHCPWPGEVVNRASVGAKVRDLPEQLDDTRADLAVVSIGVNDALNFHEPLQLDALAPALADLRSRCGRVVVLLPQLRFFPWHSWSCQPRLRRHLAAVQRHIRSLTDPVKAPLPIWCWQRDGIHLRPAGNERLIAYLSPSRLVQSQSA